MAFRTSVGGIGIIAHMTGITVIGDLLMRSGEWVKCGMIETRRNPGNLGVAFRTGGRKTGGCVIGIVRRVVVVGMAAKAGVRGVIVIPIMAGRAIIGDCGMRAIQCIVIVVNGKFCRHPAWLCGMAHIAFKRNIQRLVVGINTLIVLGRMATSTGIWGIDIISIVAVIAFVRYRLMGPCQRIEIVMIKI